jgi:hypothetical protein
MPRNITLFATKCRSKTGWHATSRDRGRRYQAAPKTATIHLRFGVHPGECRLRSKRVPIEANVRYCRRRGAVSPKTYHDGRPKHPPQSTPPTHPRAGQRIGARSVSI